MSQTVSNGLPSSASEWLVFLASLPFGILVLAYIKLGSLTASEQLPDSTQKIPPNALFFTYHPETFTSMMCQGFWRTVKGKGEFAYLSHSGFLSYVFALWPIVEGWKTCRYSKTTPLKPLQQVLLFLREHFKKGHFGLRTDSGRPYRKIRKSVLRMAREVDRPIVGVVQKASRSITLLDHDFPLPFSKLETRTTKAFFPTEFKTLSEDSALRLLQSEMDRIDTV